MMPKEPSKTAKATNPSGIESQYINQFYNDFI